MAGLSSGDSEHLRRGVNSYRASIFSNPKFGWDGYAARATTDIQNTFARLEQGLIHVQST
jgi:hypothetical protein